jgi:hypothetical protein
MNTHDNPQSIEIIGKEVFLEFHRNGNPLDSYYLSENIEDYFIVRRYLGFPVSDCNNGTRNYVFDVYKNGQRQMAAISENRFHQLIGRSICDLTDK